VITAARAILNTGTIIAKKEYHIFQGIPEKSGIQTHYLLPFEDGKYLYTTVRLHVKQLVWLNYTM
jgi:hypothetical protein